MIKLVKNVEVFSPNFLGKKDILIAGSKIVVIEDFINVDSLPVEKIDGSGLIAVPGFIDSHVHIAGGGGEGGFKTRTPGIVFSDLVKAGITTVVGCLGTDGVTRNLKDLYAKAKSLEEEGINTYIYSGSYRVPLITFTGNLIEDFILIDKVIGAGEIAVSDHRSSQPSVDELKRIVADARVGGILSNKAGIVNIHVGDGKSMLDILYEVVETTEIPVTQFLPTHINRNKKLFEEGLNYAKIGGFVDFTTSVGDLLEEDLQAWKAVKIYIENGFENQVTMSSDGQGSLPKFNEKGQFIGLGIGKVSSVMEQFKSAVKNGVPFEKILKAITQNPAKILKLSSKGVIAPGKDADILLFNSDLNLDSVLCMGKLLMSKEQILVKGTFE
ncbi:MULTISPECIES: beta-aspartyl-peptidase [Pseudothermotoga]|uniref:Isoaspartyl dipeptidase n=1 Tax=Pseudothermotoga lettingae (strain ATCC BAA-301 / DSM 14385 / NBRC 107922 / TMO) TaxID=416591 RepID=A8F3P9_PSELT|nr:MULTISPECIES: beta-aspartyl-peptidase [Pseudothermotoga]ABV32783.1 isoaspartyl dipeptidase [Pseudothermotoga lettingae TMO]GLI48222.1 isoaspartyl dipeptidase [Pseudothermotoga lettingae TMO]